MDISRKLLAAFQVEHVEHLEGIRACLARWEPLGELVDIDEAFRRAHSLKGAARITGLTAVETLAHRLESLFAKLRERSLAADANVLQTVRVAVDAMEDAAISLLSDRPAPDSAEIVGRLDQLSSAKASPVVAPAAPSTPPPEAPPIAKAIATEAPVAKGSAASSPSFETVRLSAENLDRLLQSTGRLLTENLQQDALGLELRTVSRQLDSIQREWESLKRISGGSLRRLNTLPEFAGVGRFLDLVAHEMNALSRRMRTIHTSQRRTSWSVGQIAEQLRDDVRRARMVPADSEFQGFRKMMRDLAREAGKDFEFRVTGLETPADRLVLQALKDPLMHALRNAVGHGIESPDERAAAGKPRQGTVSLELQAVGNHLTVRVDDDGRGFDVQRLAATAVERGMMTSADANAGSEADLARLAFRPGFSTAEEVTELSGRGFGLSVAYDAVMRLQGEIELRPREGGGTTLWITVPLSISTHRLLIVSVGDRTFAVPAYGVERLVQMRREEVESVEGRPMITLDGRLIPLAQLSRLLGLEEQGAPADGVWRLAILRFGGKRLAVAVDVLAAHRNALIKSLGPPANSLSLYLGGILLEDGTIAPVLNPAEIVQRYESAPSTLPLESRAAVEDRTPTILVVDDSFTTRTLETSILETNGYRVRTAVDGLEALARLRGEKIDLVISDLEMPRLDGFGLIEEMKHDPRLARIPVIVVSSVERREDQERGLKLGADAYIVKRKFDHQELLQAIRQIL